MVMMLMVWCGDAGCTGLCWCSGDGGGGRYGVDSLVLVVNMLTWCQAKLQALVPGIKS